MKIIIAALASIAFAAPAFAALPSAPAKEQLAVKSRQFIELAKGPSRSGGFASQSKSGPTGKSSY